MPTPDPDANPYAAPAESIEPPDEAKPAPGLPKGMTPIEAWVTLAIIAALVALLLPAVGAPPRLGMGRPLSEADAWFEVAFLVLGAGLVATLLVIGLRPVLRPLERWAGQGARWLFVQAKRWMGVPSGSARRASR